jgi:GDP-L-fucose synthase
VEWILGRYQLAVWPRQENLLVQTQAYRQRYGWNAIYLHPVNLHCPGDNFNPVNSHVIPVLIKKLKEAKAISANYVTAWGQDSPTQEYLYVDDVAEGILPAAERYDQSAPGNMGLGMEIGI